jgi:hypothetical protein
MIMVKFFKPKEVPCSVCGKLCFPKKKIRDIKGMYVYCGPCWDFYETQTKEYAKDLVLDQVKEYKRLGKKIDLKEVQKITDKVSKKISEGKKNGN